MDDILKEYGEVIWGGLGVAAVIGIVAVWISKNGILAQQIEEALLKIL